MLAEVEQEVMPVALVVLVEMVVAVQEIQEV
jgi:hypothetical protein